MKKDNDGMDKLFEALKSISQNGGQIHIGAVGGPDDVPDELKKILMDLKANGKNSADTKNGSDINDLLGMLSGNKSREEPENPMENMSKEEKSAHFTVATLNAAMDMEIDHDILICDFLSLLCSEKLSDEMIDTNELKDKTQVVGNIVEINARFNGRDSKMTYLPPHTQKAMDLGDGIFSSLLNNKNLTQSDKIMALSLALNNLIKNNKLNS